MPGTAQGPTTATGPLRTRLCALPSLAVSPASGQLTGQGMDGFYRDGRWVLSRCELLVAGVEPLVVQGRLTGADRARFVGTIRRTGERGPDPEIQMERLRSADGTEQITFRSSGPRLVRLPVEIRLGTDLAELGSVAVGFPGPGLQATVHGSGLRWSGPGVHAVVSATPGPADALDRRVCCAGNWICHPAPNAPSNCASAWKETGAAREALRATTGSPVTPVSPAPAPDRWPRGRVATGHRVPGRRPGWSATTIGPTRSWRAASTISTAC